MKRTKMLKAAEVQNATVKSAYVRPALVAAHADAQSNEMLTVQPFKSSGCT